MFAAELPAFDGGMIEGRYMLLAGHAVDPDIAADWERIRGVADHFLSFDCWLFSTPMWNFGIPYRLKHYVDLLTQPGMTFAADAEGNVVGKAAGRHAVIVAAGALDTRPEGLLGHLDYQADYLETWLRFIGVGDIRTMRVMPTFGPADAVDGEMARAYAEAEALAADLSRPSRV